MYVAVGVFCALFLYKRRHFQLLMSRFLFIKRPEPPLFTIFFVLSQDVGDYRLQGTEAFNI